MMLRPAIVILALAAVALGGCEAYDAIYDAWPRAPGGVAVYDAEQCTGPVINGACHGSVIPTMGHQRRCHGEMLAGRCTGPMF